MQDLRAWLTFIESHSEDLLLVCSPADVERCQSEGKLGVVLAFQNTEMLRGDASTIHRFADLGVRVMQLTYNIANAVGYGCLSVDDQGLTPFGREVVAAMNDGGVLVDLSHAGPTTLRTAICASTKPVAVSHAGCRALADSPRNVSDEDLRLLTSRGGALGIFAMPFLRSGGQPRLVDYIRHIEHAIHIVGEDHVAVGTDGTITEIDDVATYMGYLAEDIKSRRSAGVSAPGESEAVALFLPDMCGPSQFITLGNELERRGHSASRIEKLLGLNWMRVLKEVWSSHST